MYFYLILLVEFSFFFQLDSSIRVGNRSLETQIFPGWTRTEPKVKKCRFISGSGIENICPGPDPEWLNLDLDPDFAIPKC